MRVPPTPVLVSLGVLLAAALVFALVSGDGDEEVAVEPTATPGPTAEPTPTPTPTPTETEPEPEPPPAAEPFDLRLVEADGIHVISIDNAAVVSRPPLEPDAGVAEQAAEIARTNLQTFLDAQFTDPETWFGAGPIENLLTARALEALDDDARAALGQLDLDVSHVVTGEAEADPMITMHGERPRNVTLEFHATLIVVTGDGAEIPLRLEGAMLFLPTEGGWLVEAVDAVLTEESAA